MSRTKRLTLLTASYGQISTVFPFILVSPAYFAGKIQLGGLMQTASAFDSVREALSIFIDVYRELAEWRAVSRGSTASTPPSRRRRRPPQRRPRSRSARATPASPSRSTTSWCGCRTASRWSRPTNIAIEPAATASWSPGPSGAGKSTLFRAIAGIWPFGSGAIRVPAGARVMVMPQRPYFPVATLAAAVSYPGRARDVRARAARGGRSTAVGLPDLVARLDEEAHWNRMLSLGEQQRLAHRARAPAEARLPVPRRSHRLARRGRRNHAVQAAQDPACRHHPGVDRAPQPRSPPSTTGIWCWCARPRATGCASRRWRGG